MNILVTGGAGFIGSHLVDELVKKGHKVVVVDNLSTGKKENLNPKVKFYKIDICSPKISRIFQKEKPEVVYHFAAQIDVRKSVKDPVFDAKVNILGSLNLIQSFIRTNSQNIRLNSRFPNSQKFAKFIFASSGGAIYGDANVIPTTEDHRENPESPYGIAKLSVEKYLHFYQKTYGLNYVSLRFSNVYGPRQDPKGEAGVVAIFIDKLLRGKRPKIFGSGNQTRDFVYIEDVAGAALKVLNSPRQLSGDYNVGTGIEISINELYQLISKKIKTKISPIYAPAKSGDLKRSCLDYSRIKKELNWQPKYDLEKGLKETINYFRNEH